MTPKEPQSGKASGADKSAMPAKGSASGARTSGRDRPAVGSANLRGVRWLEEQGFIKGYRAEVDRQRIGLGVVLAFVRIDAERNTASTTGELEDAIRRIPEVTACHCISGSGTFELQVLATALEAFSRLALQTLLKLPNVKDLHTSFSLGEVQAGAALPLAHLSPAAGAGRRQSQRMSRATLRRARFAQGRPLLWPLQGNLPTGQTLAFAYSSPP